MKKYFILIVLFVSNLSYGAVRYTEHARRTEKIDTSLESKKTMPYLMESIVGIVTKIKTLTRCLSPKPQYTYHKLKN
jgi:hypothetical protein